MLWKHRVGSSEPSLGRGKPSREATFKLKDMEELSSGSEGEGPGKGSSMRNGSEVRKIPVVSVGQLPNLHHREAGWLEDTGFPGSLGILPRNPVWGMTHLSWHFLLSRSESFPTHFWGDIFPLKPWSVKLDVSSSNSLWREKGMFWAQAGRCACVSVFCQESWTDPRHSNCQRLWGRNSGCERLWILVWDRLTSLMSWV